MSHVIKLTVRVIMKIIQGRTLNNIVNVQYGFMPDRGTRNAVFVLRRLVERSIGKQRDVYACFIDYSKEFDTVSYYSISILIPNLSSGKPNESIKQWVRQGCVASPHLFAMYTEIIMKSIEGKDSIRIWGNVINNLRYTDNTGVIAETETKLKQLMDIVVQEREIKVLYLNCAKSVTRVFSQSIIIPAGSITIHGKRLD